MTVLVLQQRPQNVFNRVGVAAEQTHYHPDVRLDLGSAATGWFFAVNVQQSGAVADGLDERSGKRRFKYQNRGQLNRMILE